MTPHPPLRPFWSDRQPVYTIGHGTRTIPEFVGLLRFGEVGMVVDIRSIPRSRTNPQFNFDSLPRDLASCRIGYTWIAELGGLRRKSTTISPSVNAFWENPSFHNYADYALSDEFRLGLSRLLALSEERRCAMMCSEAVWWRCHRRIVADYLLHRGVRVFHLMGSTRIEPAMLTKAARAKCDTLAYPAA
jgi:uncharacterized protein (DUF488 family)